MTLNATRAVSDFEHYLLKLGATLSESARDVLLRAEQIAEQEQSHFYPWVLLAGVLQCIEPLCKLIIRYGGDPDIAFELTLAQVRESADGEYPHRGASPYTGRITQPNEMERTLVEIVATAALRHKRTCVNELDLVAGLLDWHEHETSGDVGNDGWADPGLHTSFNMLAHIVGHYDVNLSAKFLDIKSDLNLFDPASLRKIHLEAAPPSVRPAVLHLLSDHPDYARNAFLIMPFTTSPAHDNIHAELRKILTIFGINLLRADDKAYSDDLLINIEAFIYGCRMAFAVFERINDDSFNPNVSFEVGYSLGLKKPVCILKERTIRTLHADLIGRLFVTFDVQDLAGTLPGGISKWLRDKGLV